MDRVERGGLTLLVFSRLERAGLAHAISTLPLDVRRPGDRARLVAALDLDPAAACQPRQVHRADVLRVTAPLPPGEAPCADGLVTDVAGLPLCMRAADCSLIVVADPVRRAVGVAHAGWKGAARGVVVNLVRALEREFGALPSRMLAGIGPTVGLERYPVGPEVPAAFLRRRRWATEFVHHREGRLHFDLAGANRRFLIEAGLAPEHVEPSGLCTWEQRGLLHSFRREGTGAGHHGLVAAWR